MNGKTTPATWYLGARHYQLEVTDQNWIPVHLVGITRAFGGAWRDTASSRRDRKPATRMADRDYGKTYPWPVDRDHRRPYGTPAGIMLRDDPRIPGFEVPHDPYPGYV
jgi:hypothetical protein